MAKGNINTNNVVIRPHEGFQEQFTKTTVVTDEVLKEYNTSIEYAPLHNPAHLQGINACMKLMPGTPEVLVFDTSFHTTIPEYAALYAIPYEYYEKYGRI